MDTLIVILRILLLTIGVLSILVYILLQLYQKLPKNPLKLMPGDYIVYTIVLLCFGIGTNSYWGLAAFVPLLLLKIVCRTLITPKFLRGSGKWIEVDWKKFTPKGFGAQIPQQVLQEMRRMPKDNHFIVPRLYMVLLIKVISYRSKKEVMKNKALFSGAMQKQDMMGEFNKIIGNFLNLKIGKTEMKHFPFGALKVTRL
ncbi:MAG: hypothetical protein K2X39_02840 [Silvanigrellaceae bacterium]|nr:hypothetical protein [Silvanigrellaceae bacterium]